MQINFQDPVPIEKYDRTYNATEDGPSCPQPSIIGPTSEDCLFLNVYSTQVNVNIGKTYKNILIIYLNVYLYLSLVE